MKKLLALLLVLVMVFSVMTVFTACEDSGSSSSDYKEDDKDSDDKVNEDNKDSDDKVDEGDKNPEDEPSKSDDSLVGEWEGTVDMALMFNLMFGSMLDEETAAYLELDSFEVQFTFEFTDDGEYEMTISESDFEDSMEDAAEVWIDGYIALIEDMIEENELDMTVEEYAQEVFGCSVEEYITEELVGSMDAASFETSGWYELDGKKLYLDEDEEYYTIDLDGDELVFEKYSGGELDGALPADVVFERQ